MQFVREASRAREAFLLARKYRAPDLPSPAYIDSGNPPADLESPFCLLRNVQENPYC